MERKDEILKYLTDKGNDKTVMEPLVTEFLFLENQLEELKKNAVYQGQSEKQISAEINTGGKVIQRTFTAVYKRTESALQCRER